jgi:hypothetical protein
VNLILYVILLYEQTTYKLKLRVILKHGKNYFRVLEKPAENNHTLFSAAFTRLQK